MFTKQIYAGQYLVKNTFYSLTDAWNTLIQIVNNDLHNYEDTIIYDEEHAHINITLNGFSADKYVDLPMIFETNLYYLRATADFTLTFDNDLNLKLANESDGINLDIVLGKMPNNTEILVKNTYLDYNYSVTYELKYAILEVKYYIKIFDIYNNEYILNHPQVLRYIVAGTEYKRLYLLTNTEYKTYYINNDIHLSQFENTQTFYDLIDNNKTTYILEEKHEEYALNHIYEFNLKYSDICAETLNINSFYKFKEILEKLNMYQEWLKFLTEN